MAEEAIGSRKAKKKAPPKPRPKYWQQLSEAIAAASYEIEKQYHQFPRTKVHDGTPSTDFRPLYEPNRSAAAAAIQTHIDALRALKGPRTSKTDEVKANEARYWKAVRKKAVDFLREYQKKAEPGLAAHYALHGGVQLGHDYAMGLMRWTQEEREGKL